ncbi:hypothetical protein [Succinivibrio sp.]|uniref:hypothetical protein n=1 Tax=Succinivibrio sp. TaxID=2053619 RepID=UPI00386E348A
MRKLTFIILAAIVSLTGCSTYRGSNGVTVSNGSTFAVMPFVNQSNTPLAAENVGTIICSELSAKNINYVAYESADEPKDLKSILDDSYTTRKANDWLKTVSHNYVISGSVDEWNYKAGLDGEPVVSVTIRIKDVNGNVVYEKTGSRSGFGRESLNGAGQKVVENILSDINYSR